MEIILRVSKLLSSKWQIVNFCVGIDLKMTSRQQRPWPAWVDTFRIHCDKHDDGEGEYHEPDEGLGSLPPFHRSHGHHNHTATLK